VHHFLGRANVAIDSVHVHRDFSADKLRDRDSATTLTQGLGGNRTSKTLKKTEEQPQWSQTNLKTNL
jgi:hypothetical protein